MSLPENIMDTLISAIQDIQRTRMSELASSSIILFDHFITLDQEVELIWKAHWSLAKCLFIFNRYYTLFVLAFNNYALFSNDLTDLFCQRWFRWQGWTALVACMTAESILQIRLYALYFLNKRVLAFMIISFIAASTSSAIIMGTVLENFTATSNLIPGFPFCIPFGVSHNFYTFWIPILAFESLLCGMALFRGFETFRASESVLKSGRRLVQILLRDSIIYFLVMFATYLTNALFWFAGSTAVFEIPAGFSVAMSCVMGNRLILNIRQVHHDHSDTTHEKTYSVRFPFESSHGGEHYYQGASVTGSDHNQLEMEMRTLRTMRAAELSDRV